MCGIAGVFHYAGSERADEALLVAMRDALTHRGPDDAGLFAEGPIGLAMRRLSIIDLETGRQPMKNETGDLTLVFNGEIYNFVLLREYLQKKGHRFATKSDTETIVHLYEEYGDDCFLKLKGMFAFALWDAPRRRLILARDRMGIKPLHYLDTGKSLYFASEIKALLRVPEFHREIGPAELDEFLSLLYVPAPHSVFKGLRKLLPGHWMTVDEDGPRTRQYWDLKLESSGSRPPKYYQDEILTQMKESVARQLVSDVPFGAFLSGGIDSSAVVGLMSEAMETPVKTFSIGFDEKSFNELPYARIVADLFKTEHHEFLLDYPDIAALLPKLVDIFDEPFADVAAIPTYLICQEASRHVKMALSGTGGDELFAGYSKYANESLMTLFSWAPRSFREALANNLLKNLKEGSSVGDVRRRLKRFLNYSLQPEELRPLTWTVGFDDDEKRRVYDRDFYAECRPAIVPEILRNYFDSPRGDDLIHRWLYVENKSYLPDNNLTKDDMLGMAHSLEIRVPFLDEDFVTFVSEVPSRFKLHLFEKKYILKRALKGLLPDEILNRKKQGFSVPVGEWLKADLNGYMRERLLDPGRAMEGYFDLNGVETMILEHEKELRDHSHRLWALLVFAEWRDARFRSG